MTKVKRTEESEIMEQFTTNTLSKFRKVLKQSIESDVTDIIFAVNRAFYWKMSGTLREMAGAKWTSKELMLVAGHLLGDEPLIYRAAQAYAQNLISIDEDEERRNFYSAEIAYELKFYKKEIFPQAEDDESNDNGHDDNNKEISKILNKRPNPYADLEQITYRFRASIFKQRGDYRVVLRLIPTEVRTFEDLNLPKEQLEKIGGSQRGLVLVTGSTGQGKSTTVSALIQHINLTRTAHIITIEDPIEYVYKERASLITQREIAGSNRLNSDAVDYPTAIKEALRQCPDVIMIGEIRDGATFEAVLTAAESGHLVISTLHTADVGSTLERIASYYKEDRASILSRLSTTLAAIVSQRLVPVTGDLMFDRVPAVEIMTNSASVKQYLRANKLAEIHTRMQEGEIIYGMQTFDQHLGKLVRDGLISPETALEYASRGDLKGSFTMDDLNIEQ